MGVGGGGLCSAMKAIISVHCFHTVHFVVFVKQIKVLRAMFREHRSIFRTPMRIRPYPEPASRPRSRPRLAVPQSKPLEWSHNYCLAEKNAISIPVNRNTKQLLSGAGLGEKRITLALASTPTDVHNALLQHFPKLSNCGGYELLKCLPNSRSLQLYLIHHTPQ